MVKACMHESLEESILNFMMYPCLQDYGVLHGIASHDPLSLALNALGAATLNELLGSAIAVVEFDDDGCSLHFSPPRLGR